jgi:hypothetical protein
MSFDEQGRHKASRMFLDAFLAPKDRRQEPIGKGQQCQCLTSRYRALINRC